MMWITWKANEYAGSNSMEWHAGEPFPELPVPGRIISIQADEDEMRLILYLLRERSK